MTALQYGILYGVSAIIGIWAGSHTKTWKTGIPLFVACDLLWVLMFHLALSSEM